jgi:hypothetical protein
MQGEFVMSLFGGSYLDDVEATSSEEHVLVYLPQLNTPVIRTKFVILPNSEQQVQVVVTRDCASSPAPSSRTSTDYLNTVLHRPLLSFFK